MERPGVVVAVAALGRDETDTGSGIRYLSTFPGRVVVILHGINQERVNNRAKESDKSGVSDE